MSVFEEHFVSQDKESGAKAYPAVVLPHQEAGVLDWERVGASVTIRASSFLIGWVAAAAYTYTWSHLSNNYGSGSTILGAPGRRRPL